MTTDLARSKLEQVNALIKIHRVSQEEISSATEISQGQVSRILSGHFAKRPKSLDKICEYVFSRQKQPSPDDVLRNAELTQALLSVWDGSDGQATKIASVIRSLGPLTRQVTK